MKTTRWALTTSLTLTLLGAAACGGTQPTAATDQPLSTRQDTIEQDRNSAKREALDQRAEQIAREGAKMDPLTRLEAHAEMCRGYVAQDVREEVMRWCERALELAKEKGAAPGSPEAAIAAHAHFHMIEYDFRDWTALALEGSPSAQKSTLEARLTGHRELTARYSALYAFEQIEWTLAAGYRQGSMMDNFARAIWSAQVPFDEGSEEHAIYRQQLDELALPLADKGIELYSATLDMADREGVENAWTLAAREDASELSELRKTYVRPRAPGEQN